MSRLSACVREKLEGAPKVVLLHAGAGIVALVGLYLAQFPSYLLFHALVEVFSVAVAGGIFMVAWNSRAFLQQGYYLILAVAFLFVGFIDTLHLLAYKGMGVFPDDGNMAIQLWIVARFIQSVSFVIAPFFLRRQVGLGKLFVAYSAVTGAALASIFWWKIFPVCYVDGGGLTAFKIAVEYVICLLVLVALGLHWQRRQAFDPMVLRLLCASLLVTAGSELAFTAYVSVYGMANFVGHCLKLTAIYLIYGALVQVALTKPHRLLFLELKRREEEMRMAHEGLEAINRDLQQSLEKLADDETSARRIQFLLLPPTRWMHGDCLFQSAIRTSAFLSGDFVDYFPITNRHTGFYIADVSGHGVSSAFITVLLKSTMAHFQDQHREGKGEAILHPDQVLKALNEYLVGKQFGKYLTMFYGILDSERREITYSNAGQFPSAILADEGGARFLEQKSLPVGLFAEASYHTIQTRLQNGFRLALFSDGVLDLLPQSRVRQKQDFLLSRMSAPAVDLEELEAQVGWNTVKAPDDDLTILLLKGHRS